jgi:hypothetical protein
VHTVRETAAFSAQATKLLTADELQTVIDAIAYDPTKGDIIEGTGGVRKLRVAFGGRGKSSGARVIYYYFDGAHPIYALEIFAKNERADLSAKERNGLLKLTTELKAAWRKKG